MTSEVIAKSHDVGQHGPRRLSADARRDSPAWLGPGAQRVRRPLSFLSPTQQLPRGVVRGYESLEMEPTEGDV
jgi:hypothetical protein